jgi:hypothetical protein
MQDSASEDQDNEEAAAEGGSADEDFQTERAKELETVVRVSDI